LALGLFPFAQRPGSDARIVLKGTSHRLPILSLSSILDLLSSILDPLSSILDPLSSILRFFCLPVVPEAARKNYFPKKPVFPVALGPAPVVLLAILIRLP